MRIAMSVCVYYSLGHTFPQTWRGMLREMRIAMSVCVYYSLDHLFPQHGVGCSLKWELQCLYAYIIPLITYFHNMEWVAHRNENCNVCICILFLRSPIFHHGGGCWEKWLLQCMYVYIIPLITYFPNMEGVADRNENCNVCKCILFLWSPISPPWKGLRTSMGIAMPLCLYYSLDHLFPQNGGGCSQKWELQCLYMYIIPLITYFSIMEGDAERNESCNVCVCILFPWSPISPTWSGLLTEMRIAMSVCVYYSFDHLFPQHGMGCSQKWELQCLCVYIITLITYFPNMQWVAHWNENCIVCICILFPW